MKEQTREKLYFVTIEVTLSAPDYEEAKSLAKGVVNDVESLVGVVGAALVDAFEAG